MATAAVSDGQQEAAKPSPAPWTRDRFGELKDRDGERVQIWDSGLAFGSRTPQREANARVTDAAGDIYEALIATETRLVAMYRAAAPGGNTEDGGNRFADADEAVIAARAALVKAGVS